MNIKGYIKLNILPNTIEKARTKNTIFDNASNSILPVGLGNLTFPLASLISMWMFLTSR